MNSYLDFRRQSARMLIRPWSVEDADGAFAIYGDEEVARFLTGVPEESVATQRQFLEKIIAAYSSLDMGMGSFPLLTKDSGELIGAVLLKPLPHSDELDLWTRFRDDASSVPPVHEIEIGWHLRRDQWGKGYATEAAQVLLDYGFTDLGLHEVHAVLFAENRASWRVAARLGMEHLGETDRFYGKTVEHFVLRR